MVTVVSSIVTVVSSSDCSVQWCLVVTVVSSSDCGVYSSDCGDCGVCCVCGNCGV